MCVKRAWIALHRLAPRLLPPTPMPKLPASFSLLLAFALGGCGTPETVSVARTATAGRWDAAQIVADAGEIPLSTCGMRDPPCRLADQRYFPALAMNAHGEAVVLWGQDEGGYHLWASRYAPASGFGPPAPVSREAGSFSHRVMLDDRGVAVALWQWYVPTYDRVTRTGRRGVALSRFTPGQGWGPPERIGDAEDTHLDLTGAGARAVVLFQACGPYHYAGCEEGTALYASRFETGSGTLAGELVKADERSPCGRISNQARVAAAPGGDGLAVWLEYGKTTVYSCTEDFQELWASRFAAGGGWTAPERLVRASGLPRLDHPQAAIDAEGDGLLVYEQGPRYDQPSVWARRVTSAGSWLEPENLGPGGTIPVLAANRRGDAVVVWRERVGDGYRLAGRWFSKRTRSWGPPRVLQPDVATGYVDVVAAMDEAGHAVVAWRVIRSQSASSCDIWAGRFSADEGWSVPVCLPVAGPADSTSGPAVGADASGQALVAWSESDGTRVKIWARRYVLDGR
jgi:hypothetical protein